MARGNRRRADRVPGERRRQAARALRLLFPAALAVALLGAAGALAFRTLVAGDLLRLQDLRLSGLSRVRAEELLALSPARRGDHLLLSVDPDAVAAALLRHPWVASAQVRRRLPRTLEVAIVERRAAALAAVGDLYLVDTAGEPFKRAAPGDGLDLPVITGLDREAWLARRTELQPLLAGALELAAAWDAHRLAPRAAIAEIHLDADFGTTVTTVGGAEIRLGQVGRAGLDDKLDRLARLLDQLEAERRRPEVIHLDDRRHPEWVAVRLAGS